MRAAGVVYYLHADHLGSVSLVTNHTSETVARPSSVTLFV